MPRRCSSVGVVNTFIGRNPALSVDANWPRFLEVWKPLISSCRGQGRQGRASKTARCSSAPTNGPAARTWRPRRPSGGGCFAEIPSPNFGLNFDPSHLIWQQVDYVAPLAEFKDRIFHVHAKDARIDQNALNEHGLLSYPKLWHTPKIPGMGDVRWGAFFGALSDAGYQGHVAIEVEDRAFEGSIEARQDSLRISRRFLLQYLAG